MGRRGDRLARRPIPQENKGENADAERDNSEDVIHTLHPKEAARVGTMAFVAVTPRDEAINIDAIARPRLPRSNQLTISLMQDA